MKFPETRLTRTRSTRPGMFLAGLRLIIGSMNCFQSVKVAVAFSEPAVGSPVEPSQASVGAEPEAGSARFLRLVSAYLLSSQPWTEVSKV